ncbi:DUF6519 domain-containing protein [Micromonospora chersina]|uniref:DUF6519 domain-containing protein n=1 Tax=Micromonospora chersina TaxID=47854 RepID=UPI00379B9C93
MQGDFTRWTFDPRDGYRQVLLQQGRMLLDAEWNEQTKITAWHDEERTRDIVGAAGGPLDGAGFAVVDTAGATPTATAWADLRITPGRYYVDGVLVDALPPAGGGPGHKLADQPYLPKVGDLPGLPEPTADGRYAVLLDVADQHVTADQAPRLREAALGGPDTTTRARTVWQVRLVKVAAGTACANVVDPVWAGRTAPTMTAALREVDPTADPCRLSGSGGYRRLENQLYRVQVHDVAADGTARYLWSRENGSVVAGLTAIGPPSAAAAAAGMDAELSLDRVGRDEELSFREGDLVEVTSPDRELHGWPGHLATAGAPDGTALPVTWAAGAPASLAALGRTPIVRRWDGPAQVANASPDELDDAGIEVRFGAGDFRVGDHWLIPARTVRLVYGVSALSGTIDWPTDGLGNPLARPPLGPVHHVAVLGILRRTTVGGAGCWALDDDCRRLTPPLTDLVTLDLLGGDGQEAPPGQPLPEPVRVVVRNGGRPVHRARVRFTAVDGHLATGVPTAADPAQVVLETDPRGQIDVRWLLPSTGPATRVLTAVRLDDADTPVDAEVRVTGRRDEGGTVCLVVRPDTDLVQLLADLSGVTALALCLTAGEWTLDEPAVLTGVSCVLVTGVGSATRIVSAAESALRFEDCGEVQVRDLSVAAVPAESDQRNGALDIQRTGLVLVERVHAEMGDAPAAVASGITVRGDDTEGGRPVERTVVRDCRIEAGHAQTGVLVLDSRRSDVTGCDVLATADPGADPEKRFLEWLADPRFARRIARRAVHPLLAGEDALGLRKGWSSLVETRNLRFGSEIDDPKGWTAYLGDQQVRTVEELQDVVRDDLVRHNPDSRFFDERTRFAAWLRRVAEEFATAATATAGITVAGTTATDVRVRDNTVTGALTGISVALGDPDEERETVRRAWITGNTVAPPARAATAFLHQGVYVGDCHRLDVSSNVVELADGKPGYPVQGLLCAGRLGPHAVAAANTFDGTVLGIRVVPGPSGSPALWVARDNVCTTGPALVDGTGSWRDEGNVGV